MLEEREADYWVMSKRTRSTSPIFVDEEKRGLLESIKPHLEALMESGIYIRKELVASVLREAGEVE